MFWPSSESDDQRSLLHPSTATLKHVPVMMDRVLELLGCTANRNYLDLTVGGGGHAEAILRSTSPNGVLAGADRDTDALARAKEKLESFGKRAQLLYGSVATVRETVKNAKLSHIDGALIDCGVSSFQLDDSERGFSFQRTGPLDMRMDQTSPRSARDWVARVREEDLANVIFEFGEERFSRRIAKAIVVARKQKRIETTSELADIVRSAVPRKARVGEIDPATRTFQAIRIFINDELSEIKKGILELIDILPPKARLVVIAFHSLEDRIVKNCFRDAFKAGSGTTLTPKPLRPTEQEISENRRARSARLRGFEIGGGAT